MGVLKNPVFIFSLLVYFIHQLLERNGIRIHYLVDNWLDDILCMPIILGIALYVQRRFTYKKADYIFSRLHIVFTIIYCALIFEFFLPKFSPEYTADLADIIAYSIGGFVFYYFINVKTKDIQRKSDI